MARPPNLVPVFRLYHGAGNVYHDYRTDPSAPAGATPEGSHFDVHSVCPAGAVPLYRYSSFDGSGNLKGVRLGTSSTAPAPFQDPVVLGYVFPTPPTTAGYVPLYEYLITDSPQASHYFYTTNPALERLGSSSGTTVGYVWQGVATAIRGILEASNGSTPYATVGGALYAIHQSGAVIANHAWGTVDGTTPMTTTTTMPLGVGSWGITAAAVVSAMEQWPAEIALSTRWSDIVVSKLSLPIPFPTVLQDVTIDALLQCVGVPLDNHSFWGETPSDDKWAYLRSFLTTSTLLIQTDHVSSGFAFVALAAAVEVVAQNNGYKDYNDFVETSVLGALNGAGIARMGAGFTTYPTGSTAENGIAWPPSPYEGCQFYANFGWGGSAQACARLLNAMRANAAMGLLFEGNGQPGFLGRGFFTKATNPYPSVGCNHVLNLDARPSVGFTAVLYHFPDVDLVLLVNSRLPTDLRGSELPANEVVRAAYDGA